MMTTGKRQGRDYSEDFKRDAVAMVTEQGYSIAEAAGSLDIRVNMLGRWKREHEAQASGSALDQDEREELERLRRENREIRMEKEILKEALAYFTREMK
jgi:transposase